MPRVITVDHVTKRFQLGEARNAMLRDAITNVARRMLGRSRSTPVITKTALNDISFTIEQGEVVGLVGRNGAGKSTLLKILSRITHPTEGRIDVQGRVGSLLEVGTGFHEELTGRENIYMNGSILGMRKREIDKSLDQIVDFADIGEFLDTPIKRYSSGMRMRLGFSVAAHLSTDVLFVDEVLAVGDIGFQKKCLGAMRELAEGGRTVVFVSHNSAAVESLCTRAIWISDGRVKADGNVTEILRAYVGTFADPGSAKRDLSDTSDRNGTGDVRFTSMEVLNETGLPAPVVHSGDSFQVRMRYECRRDIRDLHFGLRIFTDSGMLLTDAHTWTTGQAVPLAATGPGEITVQVDRLNLMPGSYRLGIWASSFHEWHDVLDHVATLDVEPSDFYGTGRGVESRFGLMFFPFDWRYTQPTAKVEPPAPEPTPMCAPLAPSATDALPAAASETP